MSQIFDTEIILETPNLLVRPMQYKDIDGFRDIAFDKDIWKFNVTRIYDENELNDYVNKALNDRKNNLRYPFTIVDKNTGNIAGSTSYGNISEYDRRLEIGWTWLGRQFQGSGINKGCKYLLLNYAFEHLNYIRVEFKTDLLNQRSNKALQKIGAVEEGILRSHTLMHDGRRRDTVYYSILQTEWQRLKTNVFSEFLRE
ncbi:MAG: GNAT family N-acetyltransferase [Bacillota bacterium]